MSHGGKHPAERKRKQRERDAKDGIRQVCVRVPGVRAAGLREREPAA